MRYVWLLILAVLVHSSSGQGDVSLVTVLEDSFENLTISAQCNRSMALYLENLETELADGWAMRMLDSTSKIPDGLIVSYNFAEFGDFTQCLKTESPDGLIQPRYCLAYLSLDLSVPSALRSNNLRQQVHLRNISQRAGNLANSGGSSFTPTWAICLPSDCTEEDVTEILSQVIKPQRLVCQTKEDLHPPLTTKAIVALAILGFFVVIILASTAYDLHCYYNNSVPSSQLFIAFSAYTNGQKLFKINHNSTELSCLNGIRVFSMMWVVIGHVFSSTIGSFPLYNLVDVVEWADSIGSMTFLSGTLSVDTFFVIGGTLLVYVFMKARKNGVRFNIFQFYLHRYLRLTPPIAAAVLVSATLLEYMGSGPTWSYLKIDFQENCQKYWWSTLLYVQNYVNLDSMCLGQTWYLNVDTQLYLFSPLILFPLCKYPKAGLCLVVACISAFIVTPFYIAYNLELSGILTSFVNKASVGVYSRSYYLRTHTRAAPWLIGVLLGYWLAKLKLQEKAAKFKIHPLTVTILWAICIAVLLTCIYGGHSTLRGPEYDRLGNAFYIAFVRPTWSICVAWVIFACVMGYGGPINWILSLPIYQVLNRFTYSIYLLHLTIFQIIGFATKKSIYFSVFDAAYSFWGLYMISFGLSFFWILAFESPVIVIEKLIFKGTTGKLANLMVRSAPRKKEQNGV